MRGRGLVQVAQQDSGLRPYGPALAVDADLPEPGQIDHQGPRGHRVPLGTETAGVDSDRQSPLRGVAHHRDNVLITGAPGDESGRLVGRAGIVQGAGGVEALVTFAQHHTAELFGKVGECR